MKLLRRATKRRKGAFSALLHILLVALLPLLLYVFVRLEFGYIAVILVLLSKWRMFAVKPRHWLVNMRSNAVDIFVGLSVVVFMVLVSDAAVQIAWALLYTGWLLFIKPRSSALWIGGQALIAQAAALAAIFQYWSDATTSILVMLVWAVTYLCARHFLTAYDESMSRATAYVWAFFASSITWLSGHWLIFYGPVAQPALLLTALSYGLASMYYLDHKDRLTKSLQRQFISGMTIIVLFLIVFSDWSDKTI